VNKEQWNNLTGNLISVTIIKKKKKFVTEHLNSFLQTVLLPLDHKMLFGIFSNHAV